MMTHVRLSKLNKKAARSHRSLSMYIVGGLLIRKIVAPALLRMWKVIRKGHFGAPLICSTYAFFQV